jgi:trigger factor
MKAQVAPLEGNKVKVSVEVDEAEVDAAVDEAFAKFAKELRVPGFRPGKAPRRVLEARLGLPAARREAFAEHIPAWYSKAVRENAIDVIAQPEIEVTAGEDAGALTFEAVVEVRPQLKLQGYQSLRVTVPSLAVSEAEIDTQVDRLRANFAELVPVERDVRKGDLVVIDMNASRDGQALSNLSYADYSVEVGSGNDLPELDEHLPGAKAGDTLEFEAEVSAGTPAHVEVVVKQVQEKVLPDPTDEWAAEASEFSTIEELREDVRKRLSGVKRLQSSFSLQSGAISALIDLVQEEPPEVLVESELQRRAEDFGSRLDSQGMALDRYLEAVGRSVDQVVGELREQAVPAVKGDLALRAVADAEGIEPSEAEVDAYIAQLASQVGADPSAFSKEVEHAGRRQAVRSDLRKNKAFDWLVEHAEVVDEEGNPVDRALLRPEDQAGGEVRRQAPAAQPANVEQPQSTGAPVPRRLLRKRPRRSGRRV